jgi:FAD/FMN-containing dehydrogenase
MIGNNACGSRALGYGTTSDNVLGLDLIAGTGDELLLGSLADGTARHPLLSELAGITSDGLGVIRTELGRFRRQVSGYALQHLLPENGFAVTKALVEPGVVEAALQKAAAPHGWRFGPDPSTHNRCTVGGMIGNNACGSRALGYGTTSDNVLGPDHDPRRHPVERGVRGVQGPGQLAVVDVAQARPAQCFDDVAHGADPTSVTARSPVRTAEREPRGAFPAPGWTGLRLPAAPEHERAARAAGRTSARQERDDVPARPGGEHPVARPCREVRPVQLGAELADP